jgi:PAS domain S-box-containing protein
MIKLLEKQKKLTLKKQNSNFPVEDQFKLVADYAPMPMWVADVNDQTTFFNQAWLQFRGRSLDEEYGKGWMEGIYPDDFDKCIKIYGDANQKQRRYKVEYRLQRFDGQYRWVQENGIPQFTSDNIFNGFFGSCVDIHEIKEIEHRKDQFIIAASHELKTPLTSLNIYLHLLSGNLLNDSPEKFNHCISGAIDQVDKVNGLINQLLDLSRIQSGSLDFDCSVFSIGALVKSIIKKMQIIIPSHKIILNGKISGKIKGDPERISQALENLLSNAAKYSKDQNKIIVELSQDNKNVKVSVTDFGIGIDNDHLSRIFDRFYKIPGKMEDTFPGMGIGLYLSQQIAKRHGGKIVVESEKNKKTKFTLKVPVYNKPVKHT